MPEVDPSELPGADAYSESERLQTSPSYEGEKMTPFELSELQLQESSNPSGRAVNEVALRIEMGRTVMRPTQVGALRAGAVVALDALANEPVTIYANERPIALGEVMVLEDEYCVRVTELLSESEPTGYKSTDSEASAGSNTPSTTTH
ncbi:MAG: FliM/FliN family flagellar motor switch protein [Planctomycetota bacterium]